MSNKMNSFVNLNRDKINTSKIIQKPLAQLYVKLFGKDDFINECILDSLGTRKSTYTLPSYADYKKYIQIREGDNVDIVKPDNYKQVNIDGESVYYLTNVCSYQGFTKFEQHTLTDIILYMFECSEKYISYIMFNVIERATDEQIIKCIKAPSLILSDGNFMPLFHTNTLPEQAKPDVVLKCDDGNIRAHKLILITSSPLFKDVIAASKEQPIVIKFPFGKKTTSALVKIIYTQTIAFNEINCDEDLMNAIDYTRIIDKKKLLDHFVKAITC